MNDYNVHLARFFGRGFFFDSTSRKRFLRFFSAVWVGFSTRLTNVTDAACCAPITASISASTWHASSRSHQQPRQISLHSVSFCARKSKSLSNCSCRRFSSSSWMHNASEIHKRVCAIPWQQKRQSLACVRPPRPFARPSWRDCKTPNRRCLERNEHGVRSRCDADTHPTAQSF